jgi:hypothetical protein
VHIASRNITVKKILDLDVTCENTYDAKVMNHWIGRIVKYDNPSIIKSVLVDLVASDILGKVFRN